jgi:hypothetical protein
VDVNALNALCPTPHKKRKDADVHENASVLSYSSFSYWVITVFATNTATAFAGAVRCRRYYATVLYAGRSSCNVSWFARIVDRNAGERLLSS